ncbi:hypothetical protein SI65_01245 [Aspergillus cristatus]|uniref:RING-type domain-containing protein n=1 Tax=Aspergillus cristatus TaxID=573508 RepID=A0A1E3BTG6_ASPCR|nr:hypothetical protein SI65_01245 [Aspergillus cristatus]
MSNSGQASSSKPLNIPNQSTSATYHHPSSSVDAGYQRRPGGSGSFGAGLSSRNSNNPRNNQSRKNQHRRQRPRLLDDDEYSEAAVMKSTTSRKGQTSITHLMNFSLPPRPQYQPPPRTRRQYRTWGLGSGYHAVDKAHYVHANYRFIVVPNRSYNAQAANADVHLDWDSVLQVLVWSQTQSASCPICLSNPVAPRMARCGHIFCLPCLIRYMHAADEENPAPEKKARWKKCPICYDSIYVSETRPVRWFSGQEGDLPIEGGDVVLRLMKRETGNTLALPRDGAEGLGPEEDIPWFHAAEVIDYARMMKGGEDYMASQYDAEIEDLRRQEVEDELLFGDETTWTQKAISAITDSREKLRGIGNPPDISRQPATKKPAREPIAVGPPPDEVAVMYAAQHATKSGQSFSADPIASSSTQNTTDGVENLTESVDNINLNSASAKSKQKMPEKHATQSSSDHPFYFYQALPQFYLSPLDIRILKAAFGDYSLFPATILPRVEHISTGHVVDDELRKRVKYLGHLPHGCEVNFLECDWRDVVVPEVLENFRPETERRRKRNKDKEIREEKDRIRAEREEDEKRWSAVRRKRPSFGTISDPPFLDRDFQPLASSANDSPLFDMGTSSASPPQASSGFGALASPATSPPGARTVWGTAAIPSSEPQDSQAGASQDGWLQGWEDELLAQQESELIAQTAAAAEGNNASSSGGGKKKKNKKITLMSTNVRRGA